MAYAVFAGDGHYHLVRKANEHHTLCGLRTVRRDAGPGEYLPPARMTVEPPPRHLYAPYPRCEATADTTKETARG